MLVSIFCPSHYIERKKDKQEVNAKTAKAGEEAMAMTGVHQGRPPCSKNSIKMCNFGNLQCLPFRPKIMRIGSRPCRRRVLGSSEDDKKKYVDFSLWGDRATTLLVHTIFIALFFSFLEHCVEAQSHNHLCSLYNIVYYPICA